MTTEIEIPDFDFASFYYGQILDSLVEYKRRNIPEHTDESAYDPLMQIIRMQALVGHLNNVLIDLVANESTLPTAKLVESVRNHLRLIGYEMSPASPSQVDVVFELSKIFNASFEIIPTEAQVSTKRQGTTSAVYFERLAAITTQRTDRLGHVIGKEGAAHTDYTTKANSQTTPADDFTPWITPAAGDMLFFGHPNIMWNKLGLWFTTFAANITGVWEYYDGNWQRTTPTTVELYGGGGQLLFELTDLLGSNNRAGLTVRVRYNETGAHEELISQWDGSRNYVVTTGLLGQTSPKYNLGGPSPTADAQNYYTVGSAWVEIPELTDGTSQLTAGGDVEFTLPQTLTENWRKTSVDGNEAYWMRYRIIEVAVPTAPVFQYARVDQGKQYVIAQAVQGRTFIENPLGSSDGTADQEFEAAKEHHISESDELKVEDEVWTRVSNFLSSKSTDKHYVVRLGENDRATYVFGNGVTGKIPPVGVGNIYVKYRYGGDNDGNVGSNTVISDKAGLTYVNKLWNPRAASGWEQAQGATEASLEQAKVTGPASLRIIQVALGPNDVEYLAKEFVDDDGAKPYSRAKAIEEGFGSKTIELVIVAKGGSDASSEQLDSLDEYFNGNPYTHPPKTKHVVANQEVTSINYTAKTIDVEATVYGDVSQEIVENKLQQIIQPEALKDDGVTWEWDFGGTVPMSRIIHEIFASSENVTRVDLTTPSSNITLQTRELPILGTVVLTIVEP